MNKETWSNYNERDIKWAPFCWQQKDILRFIQKNKEVSVKCAIAVYVVLTQLASDYQSEYIKVYWLKIMEMSWVWRDNLRDVLNYLHKYEIIKISGWLLKTTPRYIHNEKEILLFSLPGNESWKQDKRQNETKNNKSSSIEENNRKNNKEEINRMFKIFWNLYPRKISEKESKELFLNLSDKDQIKAIKWIKKYSDLWHKTNCKYIPNPANWIKNEKWNDDIDWELFHLKQEQYSPITPDKPI